ncbi:hypothetical protein DV736_g3512, partial [Chaetothyriales sp. CBS 134916]
MAASSMPIPLPPRTPTPPPDDTVDSEPGPSVLHQHSAVSFDPKALSPSPLLLSSDMALADARLSPPSTPPSLNPFNFQPAMLAKSPIVKSNIIGQRRGHKYKHSSVMTMDQKVRFYWSVCHMFVAGYTAWKGGHSAAIQALSHLIFYDGLGALLCVLVEVFSNFEVWGRSSLVHPFGLQRMEVIAGFALSILLIFFGFDLISHNAKHTLEGIGHAPHHPHSHDPVSSGTVELTAVLAIASTLVSAVALKNHARIGKAMRFAAMKSLPSVLSNPSHFLTLSCSATLLLLPLVSLQTYQRVDKVLSLSIALAMLFLGVHLAMNVGSMLLMSYPSKEVPSVIMDIASDPLVRSVDQAKFWQAHYGLGIANLKLRVEAGDEALVKLRERISSLIRNRLSGGYGSGGQKWEVH